MRRKLVVGNWKMNGTRTENASLLSEVLRACEAVTTLPADIAVCAPAPYLAQCQQLLAASPVAWGAQDVSAHASGAYTGEVSAAMLSDFACRYVIVGHSERRAYHGESNELVAQKVQHALGAGLTPIVCVGETLAQFEAGQAQAVIGAQLEVVLQAALEAGRRLGGLAALVLAYEPVWAIGTGKTATPQIAQDVHAFLRGKLAERDTLAADKVQILYGGSVKPDNARELFAMPDIDGALVGGAALKAADFMAIVGAAG